MVQVKRGAEAGFRGGEGWFFRTIQGFFILKTEVPLL